MKQKYKLILTQEIKSKVFEAEEKDLILLCESVERNHKNLNCKFMVVK